MKSIAIMFICAFVALLLADAVHAQDPMVYPAKGQSQEQMEKDKFECYTWGKNQTGFDPMQVPQATAPPPQQQQRSGGAVRGAAGGALAGAAVGKLSGGSASKGAAWGAAGGGLVGGMRQSRQRQADQQAQQQWEQEQAANYAHQRNEYNRAYGACLEGRGYTVR